MKGDYPYNDDLLTLPRDRDRARMDYGAIAFALHFPALCDHFRAADAIANEAKRQTRVTGLSAVACVTLALFAASASTMIGNEQLKHVLGGGGAVLGLVGTFLAIVVHPRSKAPWLEGRLVTECLRQLHFRLILTLASEIVAAASSQDHAAFEQKRRAALDAFETNVIARKAGLLTAIAEDPEPRSPLPLAMPDAATFAQPAGNDLLRAYRTLRIQRQKQYADFKLQEGRGLFSAFPRGQEAVLGWAGIIGVTMLVLLHIVSGGLIAAQVGDDVPLALDRAAVLVALFALALRAIEEGLKPRTEVERYRHYQAATRRLLERFDNADVAGKLRAADDMEDLTFDEMAIFLRAHGEARFTI